MKKNLFWMILMFMICTSGTINAQFAHFIKYQTVVRDGSGNPLTNHSVSFRISILQGTPTGATLFSEIHAVTTNTLGMANFDIGNGTGQTGSFGINWGSVDYYLKVELDANGGGYVDMGTSQILSVPRAFYSDHVGSINKDQVTDYEIKDLVRSVSIPASALSIDPSGTYVIRDYNGLRFKATYSASASGMIAIPADWDSTTNMTLELYFTPYVTTTGNVCFFIRVTGRNAGDFVTDPGSTGSPAIPVTNNTILYKQTFNIPYTSLTGKKLLHIFGIQRGGTGETYTNDVALTMVNLVYTAKR